MTKNNLSRWGSALLMAGLAAALLVTSSPQGSGEELKVDPRVLASEKKRSEAVEKVQPAVVAIFSPGGRGGGSGVLIDADGYALTNFHVTNGAGNVMQCGLSDGVLYDAVLVGRDKVGDVALIKLLPKKKGDKFPFAPMGDSDKVKAGDWSLAMGNPFLLATDFTPTVTFGLISGVHRYQYPAGTLLEYTDCIQIDTSINPGNSGGPLFNLDGEIIGINGRGSFEKRGRVNSGVGYAISINQIKNFLGHLRAGLDADHASLGARVESEGEEGALSKLIVTSMIESDASRRGLDLDDELVSFAGRHLNSVNQFKNVLGLYPKGWRMPLVFRRTVDGRTVKREILVRLMGVQKQPLGGPGPRPGPRPRPGGRPRPPKPPTRPSPASKLFVAKPGFANYYFNKLQQEQLWGRFQKYGDFSPFRGDWTIKATGLLYNGGARGKRITAVFSVKDRGSKDGKNDLVQAVIDELPYNLEPLKVDEKPDAFTDPPGSGGLLTALYQYRNLLAFGRERFTRNFSHGGIEPFYPPPKDPNEAEPNYLKRQVFCEVLRTRQANMPVKWYFSQAADTKGQLMGFEVQPDPDSDPCEVYLSEYKDVDGRKLPHKMEVRFGNGVYAIFNISAYQLEKAK
jgi:serine protease Do